MNKKVMVAAFIFIHSAAVSCLLTRLGMLLEKRIYSILFRLLEV